jgi:hypothetical protein
MVLSLAWWGLTLFGWWIIPRAPSRAERSIGIEQDLDGFIVVVVRPLASPILGPPAPRMGPPAPVFPRGSYNRPRLAGQPFGGLPTSRPHGDWANQLALKPPNSMADYFTWLNGWRSRRNVLGVIVYGEPVLRGKGNMVWCVARSVRIFVPHWLVAGVATPLPLLWALRTLRRRRERRNAGNFCAKCCYDLRASNDRCPECGTPVLQRRATQPAADFPH